MKAALAFIEKMTLEPQALTAADAQAAFAKGVSPQALKDAVWSGALFNMIDRVADTLGFDIPPPEGFVESAKMLLKRGYIL